MAENIGTVQRRELEYVPIATVFKIFLPSSAFLSGLDFAYSAFFKTVPCESTATIPL